MALKLQIHRPDLVIADMIAVYRKSAVIERCIGDILLVLHNGTGHRCIEYEDDEYLFLAKTALEEAYKVMGELEKLREENKKLKKKQ